MNIDTEQLRGFISDLYSNVADYPRADFHFPTGRPLMELLGYSPNVLDRVPPGALESFAGVGYHFDLSPIREGQRVLDLGSGAGSDVFCAALAAGPQGGVTGLDMTPSMLDKARGNLAAFELSNACFESGHIESPPFDDESFDVIISNGVINLTPEKSKVFAQIRRLLVPGGRLVFSDIVTGVELPVSVRENCELWVECIGGALEQSQYLGIIEAAGLKIETVKNNDRYQFQQPSTKSTADKFQVRSISVLAYRSS
jgi:ubiquinone/menaquinone biosynthesis C-methylase UbiE